MTFFIVAGVGHGRKLAVELAKTSYVLIADDDYLVTPQTNILEFLQILEHTDADIVGGDTDDGYPYTGIMRAVHERDGPRVRFINEREINTLYQ